MCYVTSGLEFGIAASLASSTRAVYYTVWITCPVSKSLKASKASLIRFSLYKSNRMGDKQHPYPTYRPFFTRLASPWCGFILTLWFMHSFLSIFFHANRYHFPLGSGLIWSSLDGQVPSAILWSTHTVSCFRFYFILSIPIASPFPFPLLNQSWSSPSTSSIFLLLSILATMCAVRAMVAGFSFFWLLL